MRHLVVLIGGTGVIGTSLSSLARKLGLDVLSVSLDTPSYDGFSRNTQLDIETIMPEKLAAQLDFCVQERHVALIVDIIGLNPINAAVLADFAAARNTPVAVISSCLLYDHDGSLPVDESCQLVKPRQDCHAYLRDKLSVECFWRSRDDVSWRIFRCQHILGVGSILGCIPNHNRDQLLIRRIRAREPLELAKFGEIFFSWIHVDDLASAIMTLCSDAISVHLVINMTAPQPVCARNYYEIIAKVLGAPPPQITNFEPDSTDFWSLTARHNIFISLHECYRRVNFIHDLESGIRDALSVPEAEIINRGLFLRARLLGRVSLREKAVLS